MFFIFISKYFNSFLVFNYCISQKVRLNFLLVARYFLLVALCSLLFARCSLLSARCSLLNTFCSLLFARCSLLFARLLVAYCEIKLLSTAKKWFGYYETPPQIFSLQIFEIFVTFSSWWFSKFSQHAKPFSKLHKVTNIGYHYDVSITISGHIFNYFYVLEESEVEFYKKYVLKYSTKLTGKHLRWSLFYNKAAG